MAPTLELIESFGLSTWIYRGARVVRERSGRTPCEDRGGHRPVPAHLTETFDGLRDDVAKIVGVSDDREAMDRATDAAREHFGDHVTAAQSQPYYLDVTHPDANKGSVVKFPLGPVSYRLSQIATIGDMPNDVLMFAQSGLSIAMGNASTEVQRAARRVTTSNQDEGFPHAVETFILA